ncbi:MAG: tetratricopeptide repeat protein [Planctomycetia bacterium]|nr:tetratricopeptide repeat protein [Planctomycetia bacterium]
MLHSATFTIAANSAAAPSGAVTPHSIDTNPTAMRLRRLGPFLATTVVGLIAYGNSFDAPFIFDSAAYIRDNPALRRLWPPQDLLVFVQSRPLGFISFAVNYALHGAEVWGYHAVNLAIHIVNSWLLYLFVRGTLQLPKLAARYGSSATTYATVIAVLWVAHPLCTQGVTYVYQRLESLASLFYLAALLGVLGAATSASATTTGSQIRRRWAIAAVVCTVAAMLTKEIAVTIPLVALWYDRACLSASWSEVWGARRRLHTALFCTWGVLAAMMIASRGMYAGAGIGSVPGISSLDYAFTQPRVLLHYVFLSLWPATLCLDWNTPVAATFQEIAPAFAVVLSALMLCLRGLLLGRPWSFIGGAFFLILAPTSSIVPIADLSFEHRMYLPLAAVLAALVFTVDLALRKWEPSPDRLRTALCCGAFLSATCVLVFVTRARNDDYRSEITMWEDVAKKAPHNGRAFASIARMKRHEGKLDEAEKLAQHALKLKPNYVYAHYIYAHILFDRNRLDEAEAHFQYSIEHGLEFPSAFILLGNIKSTRGLVPEEIECYRRALELDPESGEAWGLLAIALHKTGDRSHADKAFRQASGLADGNSHALNALGIYVGLIGDDAAAVHWFEESLRLEPNRGDIHANLGSALGRVGRKEEALRMLSAGVLRFPEHVKCRFNLANALAREGRYPEAIESFEQAQRLDPKNPLIAKNLALAQASVAAAQGSAKPAN